MGVLPTRDVATLPPTERPAYPQPTSCDIGRDVRAGADGHREDSRFLCTSSVTTSGKSVCDNFDKFSTNFRNYRDYRIIADYLVPTKNYR